MNEPMRENLHRAFPHFSGEELDQIEERLRRYLSIAIAVERNGHVEESRLTQSRVAGSVNWGKVDPDEITNTG
jgi:hypothetical protein